jgi:hypothetical protein
MATAGVVSARDEIPMPGPVIEPAPTRRPGSVRRTSHLDSTRREGGEFMSAIERIAGAARDLVTDADGQPRVVSEARLAISLDESGQIDGVEQEPSTPVCDALLGTRVGFGFRSSVKDLLSELAGTTLGLLVDDLSGAPAPSGYGSIRERIVLGLPDPVMPRGNRAVHQQADVCAGWRTGGLPFERRLAQQPLPFAAEPPLAPSLESEDQFAWHEMSDLGERQSRRIRRLDLWFDGEVIRADAMFRDITVDPDPDLSQRVVHEYTLEAVLDRDTLIVLDAVADPRSLPFATDCPLAAASARLIVGRPAGELRTLVRTLIRGPGSCTHLNDLLRSLTDAAGLAELLASAR